ncbi:hypothetical protein [Halomicrococcus sp. SG-WS-1]|uniref:hypothetical protein n=1 Tax=Halomicrococcus sp. SG-WS-1 TaxID=3439057 RepID=UPI003F78DCCF
MSPLRPSVAATDAHGYPPADDAVIPPPLSDGAPRLPPSVSIVPKSPVASRKPELHTGRYGSHRHLLASEQVGAART